MMNNEQEDWYEDWARVVHTWETSLLPIKMHISSLERKRSKSSCRLY